MNRRQRGSIDEDSKMKRKGETGDHSGTVLNYIQWMCTHVIDMP